MYGTYEAIAQATNTSVDTVAIIVSILAPLLSAVAAAFVVYVKMKIELTVIKTRLDIFAETTEKDRSEDRGTIKSLANEVKGLAIEIRELVASQNETGKDHRANEASIKKNREDINNIGGKFRELEKRVDKMELLCERKRSGKCAP